MATGFRWPSALTATKFVFTASQDGGRSMGLPCRPAPRQRQARRKAVARASGSSWRPMRTRVVARVSAITSTCTKVLPYVTSDSQSSYPNGLKEEL